MKMKKLNHIFIIPDADRRHARMQYLTHLFKDSPERFRGSLKRIISKEDSLKLERRIESYIKTGRDPIYDYDIEEYLNSNKIHVPFDYLINSYIKGGEVFDILIRHILERGICDILSIYALQKRNLKRKDEEVEAMLKVEPEFFNKWANDNSILSQCSFKFVGNKKILELQKHRPGLKSIVNQYVESMDNLEKKSFGKKLKVYVLTPYDSEWEINQAIVDGEFNPQNLVVKEPVDLIIRCGNAKIPISGGLPYQTQFSQFISVREYFPNFTIDRFNEVLNKYDCRKRESGL